MIVRRLTRLVMSLITSLVFINLLHFQAIFKETKRPSREMQQTISQHLGLDPTTVANFFMNARRRGHERCEEDDEQYEGDLQQLEGNYANCGEGGINCEQIELAEGSVQSIQTSSSSSTTSSTSPARENPLYTLGFDYVNAEYDVDHHNQYV